MQLGKQQTLIIRKIVAHGAYLSAEDTPEQTVLLPIAQVPADSKTDDAVSVFLYRDSEDRLIATTATPLLQLDEPAVLTVKEVTDIGAFLDWGLPKDLLLPYKEQTLPLTAGMSVPVALYQDKSKRLCATMRLYPHLRTDSPYERGDTVTGIVYERIDAFGTYVAVDNRYSALIPNKELFAPLSLLETVTARVSTLHEDGRLELSLREKAHVQMGRDAELIYAALQAAGGHLPYHDKSSPEEIKVALQMSKNSFKRAIGHLMKEGKLRIMEDGIYLTERK